MRCVVDCQQSDATDGPKRSGNCSIERRKGAKIAIIQFEHGIASLGKHGTGNPAADWLRYYRVWYQGNAALLNWTEKVLVNRATGYAGTADLFIEHAVHGPTLVDLKTMKVKPGAKPSPYKSWCYQLAAYRKAMGQGVTCMNLIVNSNEPSAPVEYVWTEEEMDAGLEAFEAAHKLWTIEKGYNPTSPVVDVEEVKP